MVIPDGLVSLPAHWMSIGRTVLIPAHSIQLHPDRLIEKIRFGEGVQVQPFGNRAERGGIGNSASLPCLALRLLDGG
jgi:hypothetical protein